VRPCLAGAQFNQFLKEIGFELFTVYEYKPGVPALDSAFVTPLVVTQLLNLFLKNLIPYWALQKKYKLEDSGWAPLAALETLGESTRNLLAFGDSKSSSSSSSRGLGLPDGGGGGGDDANWSGGEPLLDGHGHGRTALGPAAAPAQPFDVSAAYSLRARLLAKLHHKAAQRDGPPHPVPRAQGWAPSAQRDTILAAAGEELTSSGRGEVPGHRRAVSGSQSQPRQGRPGRGLQAAAEPAWDVEAPVVVVRKVRDAPTALQQRANRGGRAEGERRSNRTAAAR
jgi:hypothetical protein